MMNIVWLDDEHDDSLPEVSQREIQWSFLLNYLILALWLLVMALEVKG